ncbi:hypothetical protein [Senegalia massiliensis]|uniref:hypothetical protein n=1 Tax=Senegalia massiliensis TaxID=1720316 RepID=UPI0013EF555D|nr:hypothetical protein [Senegalia massiliensis]
MKTKSVKNTKDYLFYLKHLNDEELQKEFGQAVLDTKNPNYIFKCMTIEDEYKRRGLEI